MEYGDVIQKKDTIPSNDDNTEGILAKMAKYPEVEITVIKHKNGNESRTQINGDSYKVNLEEQDEYTSDEELLIIDETLDTNQWNRDHCKSQSPCGRVNFKGFKKQSSDLNSTSILKLVTDLEKSVHVDEPEKYSIDSNCDNAEGYQIQGESSRTLNDSIFQINGSNSDSLIKDDDTNNTDQKNNFSQKILNDINSVNKNKLSEFQRQKQPTSTCSKMTGKKPIKKRPSQKLTEYAQYLGLQPAVKFKCVKCSESSFPSLTALNDHQRQCLVQPAVSKPTATPATVTSSSAPSTNFRVTRKVFLCSSCGTYYENCNLFLHMREVHKRYICLYCLGMFSLPEKLSHHLATKHNCSASKFSSANEFLNSNTESCYLICCNCERVFSERDNFFDHVCLEKRTTTTEKTNKSVEQLANLQAQKLSKSTTQKLPDKRMKLTKNNSKNFSHVEHITADSLVTRLTSPGPEQEASAAEHFMAEVLNSNPKNDSENSINKPVNPESADDNDEKGEGHCESAENVTQDDVESSKEQICEENTEEPLAEPNPIVGTNVDKEIESENENLEFSDNENMEENKKQESEHGISDRSVDSVTQMAGDFNDISDNENFFNNTSDEKNESFSETHESKEILETEKKVDSDEISAVRKSPSIETEENKQTDEAFDLKESSNDNEETRKVPKVTLKLPLPGLVYSENESDDSEKLTMEIEDNAESDRDCDEAQTDSLKFSNESEKPVNGYDENLDENTDPIQSEEEYYQVAGEEVPVVELELEQPLDKFDVTSLLKICLEATVPTCVYCNHARKIAVNGKQLGLHAMAEHRFAATVNSITAEELIPENFVARIKESLGELESLYFSLEEKTSEDGKDENEEDKFKRVYECFQCRYATSIHKELYLHNRKMHAKTILLCIMCKSNFYSYSELICHLCPGNYVLNSETKFRCCMCDSKYLPSAFRLMVHLRKRHHTCDVCLEGCYNQSKLSNHVWKHKLHHLCYRCGIAYRNKPDITKHLFWKHGTESVLCKKCLQKKWPHVYHFCIPPASFACEECNVNFSKAVYLKVHKRIHNNEKPHTCTVENCEQSFISKKLMLKHEKRHREPESETLDNPLNNDEFDKETEVHDNGVTNEISSDNKQEKSEKCDNSSDKDETKQKNIIDVYNLPALNLSESDSDDSENEKPKSCSEQQSLVENKNSENSLTDIIPVRTEPAVLEEEQKPIPILDGIWDNFKNYQATIEKRDSLNSELYKAETNTEEPMCTNESNAVESDQPNVELILAEHDYCVVYEKNEPSQEDTTTKPKTDESTEMDHDYCTVTQNETEISTSELNNSSLVEDKVVAPQDNLDKKKNKPQKKKIKHGSSSSSDSSSDSDSSSCTCGSNCSCSSSSGSSSTSSSSSDSESSSSEGKRRILARRERHRERAKRKKESETSQAASNNSAVDVVDTENITAHIPAIELPIQESDLETVESETDEDFYDEYPQRLANKMMAEKRNQLAILASVAPVSNGTIVESSRPSTPSIPEEISTSKKKLKSKKRKRKSRSSTPKQEFHDNDIPNYLNHKTPLSVQPSLSAVPTIPQSVQSIISHSTTVNATKLESSSKALVHNPGSGSETDTNLRSSKRKRVPNKFYGYSSDEEANEKTPTAASLKWRKLEPPPTVVSHVTASPHLVPPITIKSVPSPAPALVTEPVNRTPIIRHETAESGDSDDDDIHRSHTKSSSESSGSVHDSDSDAGQLHISQPDEYGMVPRQATQTERTNENLYCYCQCPYDEVSEMIACDGKDCAIEWFHFECVGIMVPPKGKWYCPDCRKKMHMHRSETVQV